MWKHIARFILRQRFWNLLFIGVLTVVMGYFALRTKMSYDLPRMLPEKNRIFVEQQKFTKQFGNNGNMMLAGVADERLFDLENFQRWKILTDNLSKIDGVDRVFGFSNIFDLQKNEAKKSFVLKNVFAKMPASQEELDSLIDNVYELPFYDGFLFNAETGATLLMITFDKDKLNSKYRDQIIDDIKAKFDHFTLETGIETHLSGLPYIRTVTSTKLKHELILFSFLALFVAAIALFAFFRSFKAMALPIAIVVINVIWAMGIIVLLGYEITMLTSIIPPLLIVIGVENSIFLTNKYHYEFRKHGNKVLALSRTIGRIGNANLFTNMTTAAGFFAFIFTRNQMLAEFGIVATITIFVTYFLTLFLLPIFFSYSAPPHYKQTSHLDNKPIAHLLAWIEEIVSTKHRAIYVFTAVLVFVGAVGITRLKTSGLIVDDIPKSSKLYTDMLFFEDNFKGIMPVDISVDTKREKGVLSMQTLDKLNELSESISELPELAKPLSIIELVKFAKQSYYNGNMDYYSMPNTYELGFIMDYLPKPSSQDTLRQLKQMMAMFVDTSFSRTRISVQMANVETEEIQRVENDLQERIDQIFPKDKYDVMLTGASIVFMHGSQFLINNLIESIILAVILIIFIMAGLFRSFRMVLVAVIPNIIPLVLTAAMMGYFGWPIKVSTILIFGIALGISADNTIQYLSRYRLELRINNGDIRKAAIYALGETGFSMFYSSIILMLGFSIFAFSSFGGIQWMGILITLTLLMGLISNLIILPTFLFSLDRFYKRREKKRTRKRKNRE